MSASASLSCSATASSDYEGKLKALSHKDFESHLEGMLIPLRVLKRSHGSMPAKNSAGKLIVKRLRSSLYQRRWKKGILRTQLEKNGSRNTNWLRAQNTQTTKGSGQNPTDRNVPSMAKT